MDFSVIEVDELARNCSTRGGKLEVKSHERAVQEQRELTTLMVIYTTPSDIPPSPREPSNPFLDEHVEERMFGTPQEETKVTPNFLPPMYPFSNSHCSHGKLCTMRSATLNFVRPTGQLLDSHRLQTLLHFSRSSTDSSSNSSSHHSHHHNRRSLQRLPLDWKPSLLDSQAIKLHRCKAKSNSTSSSLVFLALIYRLLWRQ